MKKLRLTFLFLLPVLMIQAQTKNFIDLSYIEVSGSADTLITPNEIFIRIVLSEKDTRDRVSIEEQEQKMVNVLKGLGINTEKDLVTSNILSRFQSYFLKGKEVVKTKYYSLKVKDAVTASQVFMKLEELGISNAFVERVNHTDIDNIRNTMRTNAMTNARARAIALTKPINQTIGAAIHIADVENYNQQLNNVAVNYQMRGYLSQAYESEMPKIEFEKIRVAANINVKFVLK
jgi:uncharacterized protein